MEIKASGALLYANSLTFSLPLLDGEVNTVDLMLIEALKIFYPNHYDFTKEYSSYLIDYSFISSLSKSEGLEKVVDQLNKLATTFINTKDQNPAINLLMELFPNLEMYYKDNVRAGILNKKTWYTQKRITSPQYFNRYFTYSIDNGDVSDIAILSFINSLENKTSSEIVNHINHLIDVSSTKTFLMKISYIANSIE